VAPQFDVIGFDACLMSMYESAVLLAPYGHYLYASEMLEPGHGWSYRAFGLMTLLASNGTSITPTLLAEIWTRAYFGLGALMRTNGLTMTLTDLGKMTALQSSMSALAAKLSSALEATPGAHPSWVLFIPTACIGAVLLDAAPRLTPAVQEGGIVCALQLLHVRARSGCYLELPAVLQMSMSIRSWTVKGYMAFF
jgi:hypothetical protein